MQTLSILFFITIMLSAVVLTHKVTNKGTKYTMDTFEITNLNVGKFQPHKTIFKSKVAFYSAACFLMIIVGIWVL